VTVTIRSAQISFRYEIAGQIEETAAGGTRFIYREGWRETIACCLPVASREHEWRSGLHPFFQHLGPEGWLRERQARTAHVAEEDDFGLLLRFGADCIGAVGVLPPAGWVPPVVDASELASPGRTVSGVQRKLLVYRDETADVYRPARATGPAPFIAKLNSDKREDLVRNELLSLRFAASLLGIKEVTAFQPGYVAELNETALIVTRFDRTEDGRKLRVEDFAQILCKPRGADYGGKYDASYEDVAAVIRAHSARPEIDVARFFQRLVVFALVANGDAHLKNFSLLEQPEGLRLSPVYDVVNVAMLAGLNQQFGLRIGGEVLQLDAVARGVLEAFGDGIGLPKAVIARTFRDLTTRARQAQKSILKAGDDGRDPFRARYAEIVRNQCLKLLEP